jgi:hypothetical protein
MAENTGKDNHVSISNDTILVMSTFPQERMRERDNPSY